MIAPPNSTPAKWASQAVLVNVLIDKGVITQDKLRDRFEQAHAAASGCSGGRGIAIVLEDMLTYLDGPAK